MFSFFNDLKKNNNEEESFKILETYEISKLDINRINRYIERYNDYKVKISNTEITIEAQVGDDDKMFGSITNQDIQKSLKDKGIDVDRSAIILDEPIKSLGIYHVKVKVSSEINGDVKIYVIRA